MGRKRYRDQILASILEACAGGANKTQIVYACNLNFHTVMPYLELITRNGLAERTEGGVTRYKTTAKGEKALKCMRELERLMPGRILQLMRCWLNLAQIDLALKYFTRPDYRKRVQIQNVLIH
jgi:predicted transcriptional regulator